MSVAKGVDNFAPNGKHACVECVRYVGRLSEMSKNCFLRIFNTQVQPVLLNSTEIWGLHSLSNVERVHTFVCEHYLKRLKYPASLCMKKPVGISCMLTEQSGISDTG